MLTCFIRNNFNNDTGKNIGVYTISLVPLLYLGYCFYAFVIVFKKRKVQNDPEFKLAVIKYLLYSTLYILFYFPTIILNLVTINVNIQEETPLSYFSYLCSIANISINLALCGFRIVEGYVKFDWKLFLFRNDLDETLLSQDNELLPAERRDTINTIKSKSRSYSGVRNQRGKTWGKLSAEIIKGFMRNFFIGLILCLDKNKDTKAEKTMKSKYFIEESKYTFQTESKKYVAHKSLSSKYKF
jgi:hypothetical protein